MDNSELQGDRCANEFKNDQHKQQGFQGNCGLCVMKRGSGCQNWEYEDCARQ